MQRNARTHRKIASFGTMTGGNVDVRNDIYTTRRPENKNGLQEYQPNTLVVPPKITFRKLRLLTSYASYVRMPTVALTIRRSQTAYGTFCERCVFPIVSWGQKSPNTHFSGPKREEVSMLSQLLRRPHHVWLS